MNHWLWVQIELVACWFGGLVQIIVTALVMHHQNMHSTTHDTMHHRQMHSTGIMGGVKDSQNGKCVHPTRLNSFVIK